MRSVACIAADLSQEDLAAKLGLKLQQIQRYEGTHTSQPALRVCTRNVGHAQRANKGRRKNGA